MIIVGTGAREERNRIRNLLEGSDLSNGNLSKQRQNFSLYVVPGGVNGNPPLKGFLTNRYPSWCYALFQARRCLR